MNATPGYSFRYFRTNDGQWRCILHVHERVGAERTRRGVAAGKGRRKEQARAACIVEHAYWAEQSIERGVK